MVSMAPLGTTAAGTGSHRHKSQRRNGENGDYLSSDLTRSFTAIALEVGRKHSGVVSAEARVLEVGMHAPQNASPCASGNLDIERLYPAADIKPSAQNPVGGYSTEAMHRYAVAVMTALAEIPH
jgi:hypothetical protein